MTILILSDLHLGLPKAPGHDWMLETMHRAAKQGCTGLIFAGDVIDRRCISETTYGQFADLNAVAVQLFQQCLFVPGNHDAHVELSLPAEFIVAPDEFISLDFPDGTRVHTVGVSSDPDPRDVSDRMPSPSPNAPANLGILHTSLNGSYSKSECLPISLETLNSSGYDAWALGHVHQPIIESTHPPVRWVGMGNALVFDPETKLLQSLDQ
ncbi:metallophosphoesterase [Corynebacterium incognita]|uniref:Metallophosphoesterase n=1 Tax=Corynebacterium incognita TaxID=2754725 RepID=A0A7G7CQH9_9CORY|nr:metallophosphoesterase [Corynebacterium incognita]QNE89845.1 metallophosphoesterase [Corynebacterium incognita]